MKIYVAPRYLHKSLLTLLRKDDAFKEVKLVSKEQLARYVFPSVKEEAYIFLMKKYNYSYEVADMLLQFVPYVSDPSINHKFERLVSLKEELSSNDLLFETLKDSPFIGSDAEIYGYFKEDKELLDILYRGQITPNFHFNKDSGAAKKVYEFDKVEEETYFVLNEIASLIDSGVSIKDIVICRRNNTYDYYLKKFAPLFGYKLNIRSDEKFISLGGSKEFFKLYQESHDIDLSLEKLKEEMKEDDSYKDISDLVNEYRIPDLDYDKQLDYLLSKFKEKNLPSDYFDNAVEVTNKLIYTSNKHIFVMGFAQGQYPRSFKDDKYLNNSEINLINRLNAKEKTKIDSLSIIDFMNTENNFVYSYSKKSIKEKFFPSPLIRKDLDEIVYTDLPDSYYSEDTLKLIYANLRDLEYFYHERNDNFKKTDGVVSIPYNEYDNSFKNDNTKLYLNNDITLSTTQLDLYNNCPYHYYISRILNLDEDEETFNLILGNVAHHLFEKCDDENFDFDKEFECEIASKSLKPSEMILLEGRLKSQIKIAVEVIKKREQYFTNPKIYHEIKLDTKIDDHTMVTGRVDYLVVIDDKYTFCIDYKTGSTKFSDSKLEHGVYTQLPTYVLLIGEDNRFKDYQTAGIYLNNVIDKALTNQKSEDELIPGYLKLNGKSIDDVKIFSKFDPTIADRKSSFVSGIAIKSGTDDVMKGGLVSKEGFEAYKSKAKELYKEASENIRNDRFDISPIYFSSSDNACQFCDYKDVCHIKEKDYRKVGEENSDEQND